MYGPYQPVTFIKVNRCLQKFAQSPTASVFPICKMGAKPWPIPHLLTAHFSACQGQGAQRSGVSWAKKTSFAKGLFISPLLLTPPGLKLLPLGVRGQRNNVS